MRRVVVKSWIVGGLEYRVLGRLLQVLNHELASQFIVRIILSGVNLNSADNSQASHAGPNSILVVIALLATLLAVASKNMIVDLDLFHEMALYRQAVDEGAMPVTDAFAYTPTNNPVVHHEWATGAILYVVCVSMGLGSTGLLVLKYLLVLGVGVGCFVYARRNGASLAIFALLSPVALNLGGWMAFTNIRAQLFTLFFLVIMLLLLDLDRKGKRWWIAVWLPLVVVWGNVHGGVVSGIGLIGCYGIARTLEAWLETKSIWETFGKVRHLIATGVATAGLLNVSPYGWDYVPYLIRAIRMPRALIPEWNPIWASKTYDPIVFYLIAVAVAATAIYLNWQQAAWYQDASRSEEQSAMNKNGSSVQSVPLANWQRDLFTPLALLLTAYMAAKHYRHGSLFAVTWICLVPPVLMKTTFGDAIEKLWISRSKLINVAAVAMAFVSLGLSIKSSFWELQVPGHRAASDREAIVYPVGPIDYLKNENFEGNLFVPFNVGAYVSWKLFPNVKVSLDSRYEVAYPAGALEENFFLYHAHGAWPATLEKYPTDAVLVPKDLPFAKEVPKLCELDGGNLWKLCYEDSGFLLIIRTERAQGMPYMNRGDEAIKGVFP